MNGTEPHANSVNVDPDAPPETAISDKDYSNPIYRQSTPHGDDIAIIKAQIDEDMHDLDIFTSRVEAQDVKISKKTQSVLELKAELEMLKKKHQETARQLLIERDIEKSFESQSQEFASRIGPSMGATDLMKIHSSNTDDALFLIRAVTESLYRAQEKYFATISGLQRRLGIESACLRLLSDRKRTLELICGEFYSSMRRNRPVLPFTGLPTEILIQIFDMAVEGFIQDKTTGSHPFEGHPTLNIALVCQRWHDIAMATARLWRYIPITTAQEVVSSRQPLSSQWLCQRANQLKGLFLDLIGCVGEANIAQIPSWCNALRSLACTWENMRVLIPTILSINYRGFPMSFDIPFTKIHTYSLYNLYPILSPSETIHVTSLLLHFRSQPSLPKLVALLRDLQSLTSLEVLFQGRLIRPKPGSHASCPSLKRLGVRLSMVPLFFSGERSVSRALKSLTVHADTPYHSSFLRANRWHFTVESSGLATGLQYLALDGGESVSATGEFLVPLLWGLKSLVTLALYGPFLGPILDKLSKDQTLLPSLHCLEMCGTDIDQKGIEEFLYSRLEPRDDPPASVSIRELVLDHCDSITRDFCDRMGGKVEKLVIYC